MVQIEPYFFDEEVFMILQPRGKFLDWDAKPESDVQVISVSFSQKYYIPVTHDILIRFSPIKDREDKISQAGLIKVRARLQTEITSMEKADPNSKVIDIG